MRGYRVGGLAVPVLGLALAGCGTPAGQGLGEAVLVAPEPEPMVGRAFSGDPDRRVARGRPNRTMPGMREAPEIFAATGTALWDGHPTLEGLWVAHSGTDIAHRVRVRNPRTGTVIDAALLPLHGASGAEMAVSAEAAEALGLVPSVPAELALVAIEPQAGATAGESAADRPGDAPAPVPATPITDGRAYIQPADLASSANAARLGSMLAGRGVPAARREETIRDEPHGFAVAGPFATAPAPADALRELRVVGVADRLLTRG